MAGCWEWVRMPSGRTLSEFNELCSLISKGSLSPSKSDSWRWGLSSNGIFMTNKLSKLIDLKNLHQGTNVFESLRNDLIPKKVEVFVWKARKKRLPSLVELDKRVIDLHSVRCKICDDVVESVDHTLIFCKVAFEIWTKVCEWWGINRIPSLSVNEIFQGSSPVAMSDLESKIWQAVTWTCGYLIWWNRNQKTFSNKVWSVPVALCEIQVKSFEWIAKRCRKRSIDWHNWIHNPHVFLV
ncbi:uncharacterized protein [Rutidosis leptorrhynchoides]|uniref:uncharacterized protein n=1 Tax=Rutidosis leptorrhynchoides TaxID=125765 RepID=UPI003A9A3D8C